MTVFFERMPVKTPEPMKKAPKSKASTKKQSKKTSAAGETNVRKRIASKRQPAADVVDDVDVPSLVEPAPSEGAPSTAASDVESEVSPYPT